MVMVIASCQVAASIVHAVVVDGTSKKKRTKRKKKKMKMKKKRRRRESGAGGLSQMPSCHVGCVDDLFARFIRTLIDWLFGSILPIRSHHSVATHCIDPSIELMFFFLPPPLSLSSYFSLYLVLSFSMSVSVSVCSFCYCQSSFRAVSERFEFLKWSVMVAALKPALGCRQEAHLITNLSFQYRVQDSILKTEIQSNFKSKQRREDQLMMFALLVSVSSL